MTNQELCEAIQSDRNKQQSIEKLYQQNRGLIAKLCNKYSTISSSITFDDLMQESYFSLVKAAEGWNPEKETNFSTYLFKVLSFNLRRYIDDCGSMIRKPSYKNKLLLDYDALQNEYLIKEGRLPTDIEACKHLRITRNRLDKLKTEELTLKVKSFSEPLSEDSGDTIAEVVPDPEDFTVIVNDKVVNDELAVRLCNAINKLQKRKQTVIRKFYYENKSTQQISEELGMSINEIRSAKILGIEELRKKHSKELRPFIEDRIYSAALKGTGFEIFKISDTSSTEYVALKLLDGIL